MSENNTPERYYVNTTSLISVANSIRTKGGTSESLVFPAGFVSAIEAIQTGASVSLQSKTVNPSESSQTVTADNGYDGLSQVTVGAISSSYVGSGIARKSSQTYTPGRSNQVIESGQYLDGNQIIAGDTNLIAGNIKSGKTIFGVAGSYSGDSISLQTVTNIAPTELSQTITADDGYDGLSSVQINAIDSNYIGSGVERKSSSDLTASGAKVTVPVGYYASTASKTISSGSVTTPATTITTNPTISVSNTGLITASYSGSKNVTPVVSAGYISSGTAGTITVAGSATHQLSVKDSDDLSVNGATVTVPAGYYAAEASKSIGSGSATTPATSITANPSISVNASGLITASVSGSKAVTPTVSAGYVTSGTSGTITVSGSKTQQLTTKAAATYTPTTTDQTIAAGQYLTGAQTISGDANLVGNNILSGKTIFGVAGTVAFQTYYTGSSAPSSSLGSNGDIYLQS